VEKNRTLETSKKFIAMNRFKVIKEERKAFEDSGVADAVAYDTEGRIEFIVDWKSDVDIDKERLNSYREQLDAYRRHAGAPNAFLVLMTPGKVIAA
jgi:hypothetical protein